MITWRFAQAKFAPAAIAPGSCCPSSEPIGAQESWRSTSVSALGDERCVHRLDVIGRDLVAESARAGVQHDDDLPGVSPSALGELRVEQLVDRLDLEEVVPRPERPELAGAALARAVADSAGSASAEPALLLLDRRGPPGARSPCSTAQRAPPASTSSTSPGSSGRPPFEPTPVGTSR